MSKFCYKCGAENNDYSKFCKECGKELTTEDSFKSFDLSDDDSFSRNLHRKKPFRKVVNRRNGAYSNSNQVVDADKTPKEKAKRIANSIIYFIIVFILFCLYLIYQIMSLQN